MGREVVTLDHFAEWGVRGEQLIFMADWFSAGLFEGLAWRSAEGVLNAIGGVALLAESPLAIFDLRPHGPGEERALAPVHRMALKVILDARRRGAPHVDVVLDEAKPKAREWLARLGFVHHQDRVWRFVFSGRDHAEHGGGADVEAVLERVG